MSRSDEASVRPLSGRDHFHAWRKAEFMKQLFAIIPSKAKRAHVGHAEAGDHG